MTVTCRHPDYGQHAQKADEIRLQFFYWCGQTNRGSKQTRDDQSDKAPLWNRKSEFTQATRQPSRKSFPEQMNSRFQKHSLSELRPFTGVNLSKLTQRQRAMYSLRIIRSFRVICDAGVPQRVSNDFPVADFNDSGELVQPMKVMCHRDYGRTQ